MYMTRKYFYEESIKTIHRLYNSRKTQFWWLNRRAQITWDQHSSSVEHKRGRLGELLTSKLLPVLEEQLKWTKTVMDDEVWMADTPANIPLSANFL